MSLRYLYLTLANYEAQYGGNIRQSLEYFNKGFEHHKEYRDLTNACRIYDTGEYNYFAPLVSKATTPSEKFPSIPENFWKNWMQDIPKKLYDELRKNEKYAECFE